MPQTACISAFEGYHGTRVHDFAKYISTLPHMIVGGGWGRWGGSFLNFLAYIYADARIIRYRYA